MLRRVPIAFWIVVGLIAIGGIATAVGGSDDSDAADPLTVGDCATAAEEPEVVACDDEAAEIRITEVFDDEYTAGTLATLSCPEGSSIIEQRSAVDDEDVQAAACAEPLP